MLNTLHVLKSLSYLESEEIAQIINSLRLFVKNKKVTLRDNVAQINDCNLFLHKLVTKDNLLKELYEQITAFNNVSNN